MKEIRLHGRGGQGTVKASELIVRAAVRGGRWANAIPYFGFERSGAPVSAFVRISDEMIWPKTQVYRPDCLVVMDASVRSAVPLFEGVKEGSMLIINSDSEELQKIELPDGVQTVGFVDATQIAHEELGRPIPNTVMLGAFARVSGWVAVDDLRECVIEVFGAENGRAVSRGYEEVSIVNG